jgi:hypothetical protein
VLWVRRVLNKRAQLILWLNKSTLQCLREQKGCLDQEIHQWTRLVLSIIDPMAFYRDNNGTNAWAKEPRFHQRSKQVIKKFHLIW